MTGWGVGRMQWLGGACTTSPPGNRIRRMRTTACDVCFQHPAAVVPDAKRAYRLRLVLLGLFDHLKTEEVAHLMRCLKVVAAEQDAMQVPGIIHEHPRRVLNLSGNLGATAAG